MIGNVISNKGKGIIDGNGRGIIIPNGIKKGPDDYFDPTTHTATEANFIKFLQAGIYTEDVIGYKVILSNTANYNNGVWIIADVNHDSANTGQTNCYDLISVDCFYRNTFGNSQNWRDSNMRTWLNNTFYNGLSSDIKSHIINIKYNSQGTWYNDDKVIMPSCTEINYSDIYNPTDTEGIVYPIFTDKASRIKYQFGTTSAYGWWTRTRFLSYSYFVWFVSAYGSLAGDSYGLSYYVVPTLRIS